MSETPSSSTPPRRARPTSPKASDASPTSGPSTLWLRPARRASQAATWARAAPDGRRPGRAQLLRLPQVRGRETGAPGRRRHRTATSPPCSRSAISSGCSRHSGSSSRRSTAIRTAREPSRRCRRSSPTRICSPAASWISRRGPRCVAARTRGATPSAEPRVGTHDLADQPGDLLDRRDSVVESGVAIGHDRDEHRRSRRRPPVLSCSPPIRPDPGPSRPSPAPCFPRPPGRRRPIADAARRATWRPAAARRACRDRRRGRRSSRRTTARGVVDGMAPAALSPIWMPGDPNAFVSPSLDPGRAAQRVVGPVSPDRSRC